MIKNTDRDSLAKMMMGAEAKSPQVLPSKSGPALLELRDVVTPNIGSAPGLKSVNLALKSGQIIGLAGVSGNGQASIADVVGGLSKPIAGKVWVNGVAVENWSPRDAVDGGIARIPEDRHSMGSIADFDITENSILERYNTALFSWRGWLDWESSRAFANRVIEKYDVRCPGVDTPIRLLSGGNMQKLILGRVLECDPKIILANQPVRGLDVGAVNYVHSQLLSARDRGATILLISEDLDEVMSLSDVIYVISDGRLSPEFGRGEMTPAQLGVWMGGQGFDEEITHAT